nr:putative reverse transcriptase domain-containing protein [Tanacetum cinerariifolium]
VPDVPTYEFDDEEISWKSSEDDNDEEKISEHDDDVDDQSDDDDQNDDDDQDDDDDDDEQTDSDNDGDDFVHPKANKEDDGNELYGDMNINLEGRDIQMAESDDDDQNDDDDQDDDDDDDEQTDSDNDGDDFVHPKFSTHNEEDKDEESFDHIVQTSTQVENTDDEDNAEDSHGMNVEGYKRANKEDDGNELYGDMNINLEGRDIQMAEVHTTQVIEDTHVTLTLINLKGQQQSLSVSIVDKYLDHRMNEATKVAVQLQSDRIRDEAQAKNEDFLNKLDNNQKIIKEQVKEQVKVQVSNILPKIEKTIHEHLEAENKTLPATHGRIQPWINNLAKKADSRTSFNELIDTPVDFSAFVVNRLKVDTLTPELLAGLTYKLMKGSCKSLVELKLFLEEVYKATTDQLDWNNPEGYDEVSKLKNFKKDAILKLFKLSNQERYEHVGPKSQVHKMRKPMDFQVGDKVMLKVSPWKGVVRFGKRGKLNPRYVGLFRVLEKVGTVAYKLDLPQELSRVHNTFHVSNLKKYYSDDPLTVPLDGLRIDDQLHIVEEPVEIMDREVKRLKQSRIPIIK